MIAVSRSLRVNMARDGRSARALAEDMWGPWADLGPDERDRKRKAGAARLRRCVAAGWISDPGLAKDWATAYGISVAELMFGESNGSGLVDQP